MLYFQNFLGEHAPDPSRRPKNFFSPLRGNQDFLGTLLKPVKFWAESAPGGKQVEFIAESNQFEKKFKSRNK